MRFFRWESWAGGSRGLVGVVDRWESWELGEFAIEKCVVEDEESSAGEEELRRWA